VGTRGARRLGRRSASQRDGCCARTGVPPPDGPDAEAWARTGAVPFSSGRKWSAASFSGHGSWVMGAPEMVLDDAASPARVHADELAAGGRRVLAVAHTDAALDGEVRPPGLVPVALAMFSETIRPDAAETLRYFHEQGVQLKVISGDNPRTVAAVAARVGLPDGGDGFDARELPDDQAELAEVLEEHASVRPCHPATEARDRRGAAVEGAPWSR